MSESNSSSPTHNRSDTNITRYPPSTTSRPHILLEEREEEHPSARPTREYREPLTVRLSPPPPPPSEPQGAPQSSPARSSPHTTAHTAYTPSNTSFAVPSTSTATASTSSTTPRRRHRSRSTEHSPDQPMAKRMRRDSPAPLGRPDDHSSPSSDSQDDDADNEMDLGQLHRPEPLPQASVPPKKKRTRTLTTPHQSAVLHALLAQSRFPTTAMREEVGRSIGLSARKVQNQRQKARRPRSQSDTPTARPPQYGPFPNAAETISHVHRGFEERGHDRTHYARNPSPEHQQQPTTEDTSIRLLGPGMPGAPVYAPQSYRQVRPPPISTAMPVESRYQAGYSLPRVLSPQPYSSPRMYPLPNVRPATSQPSSWRERDPSRTLPPLESTRPSSSHYVPPRMHAPGAQVFPPPSRPPFIPHRSISPEPRFAHHPPEPPAPRQPITLPPPFTLQPSPQWDEASYVPRPSSSAWSRPDSRSTRGRSTSPVALRREHIGSSLTEGSGSSDTYYLAEHPAHLHSPSPRTMPPTTTPPSRSGRYDPVRATYVPFSTPTVSPTVSPTQATGGGGAHPVDERADRNDVSPAQEDQR
ncbi:hypothetical protein JR316_0012141 [Psilocybe cubensis]|uniref:Uncharacterized protein n=2 Tax=Psilocybe cubensis TaxID=181762 RepID=A0ACB8GIZ7_PSICU|nr:hypothetical protein JR316_0012141 [Psilocybe cubensis]KAH9475039.1 hypothetical protein JR316_0012141 [Psilocybe cubensis]